MTATPDASPTPAAVEPEAVFEGAVVEGLGSGFAHLHVHTEFSKQDGLARLGDLIKAAKADGQTALAMTDHGNMAGAWKFAKKCVENDLTPILGVEAYIALVPADGDGTGAPAEEGALAWDDPGVRFAKHSRMEPDAETGQIKRNTNNHLTLIAENETGWRNLCQMARKAEDSFYAKPLIDYALLREHSEGVIVLTGCLGGPVASRVAMARSTGPDGSIAWNPEVLDQAREGLRRLVACVGADNVFVEIMEHGMSAEGLDHIKMLVALGREQGLPAVVTNDSHFVDCCEAGPDGPHSMWLASGSKKTISSPDRWTFNGHGYHLRTAEEIRSLYAGAPTWAEACDNTLRIAARIAGNYAAAGIKHPIPDKGLRLPKFPVPTHFVDGTPVDLAQARIGTTDAEKYLFLLADKGARALYGTDETGMLPLAVRERLAFEFGVFSTLGLADYPLIVADVIEWCRSDRGYPTPEHPYGEPGQKKPIMVGPGRGSAAGSVVSYALGIVGIDPIANGLLFERFLDPSRVGMPDVDVDFETRRRDEVYDYCAAKYGADYVARIGAFQMAKTRRAIKDAARVLELSSLGDALSKEVPVHQGTPATFAMLFEEILDDDGRPKEFAEGTRFRDMVAENPDARRIVDLARAFENVAAGEGIHAAGLIISDEPLTGMLPLRMQRKGGEFLSQVPVAWWDGVDVDEFGLLKLDALALRNLDMVAVASEFIGTDYTFGPALPDETATNDPKVKAAYDLLREGRTQGVFQLDSRGMTDLAVAVGPDRFDDVSALLALYRPGPMGANMHVEYADRKNGRSPIDYGIFTTDERETAVIQEVLGTTYGVICYQEQLMALSGTVAGFDAKQRSWLRKAISKKKGDQFKALHELFIEQGQREMTLEDGSHKIAFGIDTLERLWETFQSSAAYLFNKSHSAAYGYLSFLTAYLKAAYPTEYGAALLALTDKADKRLPVLRSLAAEGITVVAPDINRSSGGTAPDPFAARVVRLGLTEIRDVGSVGADIVAEREANGPFGGQAALDRATSGAAAGQTPQVADYSVMADLIKRVPAMNSGALMGLIEAGAFDAYGGRLGHAMTAKALMRPASARGAAWSTPTVHVNREWSPTEKAQRMRHRIGVVIGEHPVHTFASYLRTLPVIEIGGAVHDDYSSASLSPMLVDDAVAAIESEEALAPAQAIVGVLASLEKRTTKRGELMANFVLEGGDGSSIGGVVFPSTFRLWETFGVPEIGSIVVITGKMQTRSRVVETEEQTVDADGNAVTETVERTIRTTDLVADTIRAINPEANVMTAPTYFADDADSAAFSSSSSGAPFDLMASIRTMRDLADFTRRMRPIKDSTKDDTKVTGKTTSKTASGSSDADRPTGREVLSTVEVPAPRTSAESEISDAASAAEEPPSPSAALVEPMDADAIAATLDGAPLLRLDSFRNAVLVYGSLPTWIGTDKRQARSRMNLLESARATEDLGDILVQISTPTAPGGETATAYVCLGRDQFNPRELNGAVALLAATGGGGGNVEVLWRPLPLSNGVDSWGSTVQALYMPIDRARLLGSSPTTSARVAGLSSVG